MTRGGFIFARVTPRAAPVEEEPTTPTSGWLPRINRLLRRVSSRETPRVEGCATVVDATLRPMTPEDLRAASDWLNDPRGHWRPRR